jgi:hypothetical protein
LQRNIPERMEDALRRVEGAFSIVAMTRTKLIGVRDPLGVRPLVLGKLGDGYALSSETCALDIIGADFVREIEPGEMVVITEQGLQSHFPFRRQPSKFCIFEHVYFSRPDSILGGRSVYETREAIGRELAKEAPVDADLVCPVPDSGTPAAIGYSLHSGIPYAMGIIRNQYMGRTFIEPTESIRNMGVRLKLNVNRALVRQGLKVMAGRGNPGLVALADRAGLDVPPGAYHLGYVFGPRINAGGRIGAPDLGARLLATDDAGEAAALADQLETLNADRRGIEAAVRAAALAQAEARGLDGLILLETNTQPGMTPTSLVPEIAAHAGVGFPALVARLMEGAQCRG